MKTIQINQCTREELEWLPGVGPKTAQKIVKARPIEAETELEQLVPPSAWLKIQEADVEFAFGTDGEEAIEGESPIDEKEVAVLLLKEWAKTHGALTPVQPPIILQEPEPMTLRRVLPGQELKVGVGAEYVCIWNMRWGPDGAAYMPHDEAVQKEITKKLKEYNVGIQFAHHKASVRVNTDSYGPIPLVLFEIVKETEDAEEETGENRQRNGQGD